MGLLNRPNIVLALALCAQCAWSQQRDIPGGRSCMQLFRGYVHIISAAGQNDNTEIRVHRLDPALRTTDSCAVALKGIRYGDLLQLQSDTLHGYLNIYAFRSGHNKVAIIRLTPGLKTLAEGITAEAARLNNTQMFASGAVYNGSRVYSLRAVTDSGGRQFYLEKFRLMDSSANFDYTREWQHPFERKQIQSMQLLGVQGNTVMLFASASQGLREGQWLLQLDTRSGKTLQATRMGKKGDGYFYVPQVITKDTINQFTLITGQRVTAKEAMNGAGPLNIQPANFHEVFLLELDSLSEIVSRKEFRLPVNEPKITGIKPGGYLIRMQKVKAFVTCDLFKNRQTHYQYVNTCTLNFSRGAEGWEMTPVQLAPDPEAETWYNSSDKKDPNGRLMPDSAATPEHIWYKRMLYPGKISWGQEPDGSTYFVLSKNNTAKQSVTYAVLNLANKRRSVRVVEEPARAANPMAGFAGGRTFLAWQLTDETVRIRIIH
jgi:hypothetical protein